MYVVNQTESVVLSDGSVLRYAMSQRQADTQNTKSNRKSVSQHGKWWDTILNKLECTAICRRLVKRSIRKKKTHTPGKAICQAHNRRKKKKYRKGKNIYICVWSKHRYKRESKNWFKKNRGEKRESLKEKHSHWSVFVVSTLFRVFFFYSRISSVEYAPSLSVKYFFFSKLCGVSCGHVLS